MKIKLHIHYVFAGILFLMLVGCSGTDPLDGTSWILTAHTERRSLSMAQSSLQLFKMVR